MKSRNRMTYTKDIREMVAELRDGRRLLFTTCWFGDQARRSHEATQARRARQQKILDCTEDGKILIVWEGRDCDGVEYEGRWSLIDATKEAIEAHIDNTYEWADGPCHYTFAKPSERDEIEYSSRDRTLEAFEDGHPHCIHSRYS